MACGLWERLINLWLVCWTCHSLLGVTAGHPGFCNRTQLAQRTDTLQLLQTTRLDRFPSHCFLLEDHYHVDSNGVLKATLRFGPGGNAGPSDVRCIASKKVKEIVGSLSVTGALSLTSILLPTLERVRGSLSFLQLPKLVSQLFRLDALKSVNENLVIRYNEALTTVSLRHLLNVGRTLEVRSNRMLETLLFRSLAFVGLHLLLESNPELKLIKAESLKEIRFDLIIGGNNALEEIELQSLENIGEDLVIYVLDDLRSIGFPLLSSIGEDAEFAHLVRLQHLTLPHLKFIGEDFEVHHCYSLESVSMPSLRKVKEDVEIHNLPVCTSISLPDLVEIDEDLEMYNLGALTSLSLPSLKIVLEDLIFGGMAVSESLSMRQLTKVGGSFWLYNMPNLSTIDFKNLAHIGGKKKADPSQSSCHYGLGECDIDGEEEDAFYITNNTRLEHVHMPKLVSISCRYFAIFGNGALLSVKLPRLSNFLVPKQRVSCVLSSLVGVFGNDALTSLELNAALLEPRYWIFEDNAPSFCPSGPLWATATCGGGTVSLEQAEETIFGCQCHLEVGFEDSFLDGFCRQAQCPQYAVRNTSGTCSTCLDADDCLILSKVFVTVPDPIYGGRAINGSILLTSEDLLPEVKCIRAGSNLTSINGCLTIQGCSHIEAIDFEDLVVVSGSLTISGNIALQRMAGFDLKRVHLDLVIQGNPVLSEMNSSELEEVDGRFSLMGLASLKTLELPALSQVGSFFLASNTAMESWFCRSFFFLGLTKSAFRAGIIFDFSPNSLLWGSLLEKKGWPRYALATSPELVRPVSATRPPRVRLVSALRPPCVCLVSALCPPCVRLVSALCPHCIVSALTALWPTLSAMCPPCPPCDRLVSATCPPSVRLCDRHVSTLAAPPNLVRPVCASCVWRLSVCVCAHVSAMCPLCQLRTTMCPRLWTLSARGLLWGRAVAS